MVSIHAGEHGTKPFNRCRLCSSRYKEKVFRNVAIQGGEEPLGTERDKEHGKDRVDISKSDRSVCWVDKVCTYLKPRSWIVVVPEAHALPPEVVPVTSPDFGVTVTPYLIENQRAVDQELFRDIIPFIQTHYNISHNPRDRAIAGLSMGGLQSIETGIVHLGYFRWIGAFSPGVLPAALSDEFRNALRDSNKINENLLLFDIVKCLLVFG